MRRCCVLTVVLVAAGCSKPKPQLPDSIAGCKQAAVTARDQAQAARSQRDPEAAEAAAERAGLLAAEANRLLDLAAAPDEQGKADAAETGVCAQEAKRLAGLTAEDQRLDQAVTGWKAKGYRGARRAALAATFKSLSLAAGQMQKDPASSQAVRESAELAAEMTELLADGPVATGTPDWAAVAKDLDAMSAQPPPQMALFLALSYLLTGQNRLALYEIESPAAAAVATPKPSAPRCSGRSTC